MQVLGYSRTMTAYAVTRSKAGFDVLLQTSWNTHTQSISRCDEGPLQVRSQAEWHATLVVASLLRRLRVLACLHENRHCQQEAPVGPSKTHRGF